MTLKFFATAPKGIEELLGSELDALGALNVKLTVAGVHFQGGWDVAYKALLYSRLASRILFPIAQFPADTPETLYGGFRAIDWLEHLDVNQSFAIDANLSRTKINHSHYAAQKAKDAIVDQFREKTGQRPDVDRTDADVRLNLHIRGDEAFVSIDLSGTPLHRRGYRHEGGKAPLKENLAAVVLMRTGWPAIAEAGGALIDPLCGSGTLLIEGVLIAAGIAPGLLRDRFGLFGWKGFDSELWSRIHSDAESKRQQGLARLAETRPAIWGFDRDERILDSARANIRRAGLESFIQVGRRDLARWQPSYCRGWTPGLVLANPPYGERLGALPELPALYETLGRILIRCFTGWQASIFTGNPILGKQMGIRARKRYKLFNGAIACELLNFTVSEEWFVKRHEGPTGEVSLSEGANMFANRLRKNLKNLRKWVKRERIGAYRVYDADMPEYNVAVDIYGDSAVISEYAAPGQIDPEKAEAHLHEVLLAAPLALGIASQNISLKQRRRQKEGERYQRLETSGKMIEVREAGLTFLVNPKDYLDVGLFNDHRPIRAHIRALSQGKRFLNLFAYTGTATVAAAAGGAWITTTVDLSNTYLDWAQRNFECNGFHPGGQHQFVRADCLDWLKGAKDRFDLIFLDPPTFSNSKSFNGTFEVQRDHVFLIQGAMRLLRPGGLLIFSNNFRRFKLDEEALADERLNIKDITAETIPPDYSRNPHIHQCFEIWRGSK